MLLLNDEGFVDVENVPSAAISSPSSSVAVLIRPLNRSVSCALSPPYANVGFGRWI